MANAPVQNNLKNSNEDNIFCVGQICWIKRKCLDFFSGEKVIIQEIKDKIKVELYEIDLPITNFKYHKSGWVKKSNLSIGFVRPYKYRARHEDYLTHPDRYPDIELPRQVFYLNSNHQVNLVWYKLSINYDWSYQNDQEQFLIYDTVLSDNLEYFFNISINDPRGLILYYFNPLDGYQYYFDLLKMEQMNISTQKIRKLKREIRPLALPPIIKNTLIPFTQLPRPEYWTDQDLENLTSFKLVPCPTDLYNMVAGYLTSLERFRIQTIEYIVNPFTFTQHCVFTHFCNTHREKMNNIYVYHGCPTLAINSICQNNFNQRLCNRHMYGYGNYFSLYSSYSLDPLFAKPDEKGQVCLLVCRLVYSKTFPGHEHLKGLSDPFSIAVNDLNNPSIFVSFQDYQVWPEFLVICNKN